MRAFPAAALLLLLVAPAASSDDSPEVREILARIKGKENLPASEVFQNVKHLGDIPAGRFLRIMDFGFSRSLGVSCDHCHVEGRWEADDKRPKRAAREMWELVQEINASLGLMHEIETAEATVNCTTCHRGYLKPALQMK
jgi:hypothetical protein